MAIYFPTAVEYKAESSVSIRRLEVRLYSYLSISLILTDYQWSTANGNPEENI
jgi:hypothetical protein